MNIYKVIITCCFSLAIAFAISFYNLERTFEQTLQKATGPAGGVTANNQFKLAELYDYGLGVPRNQLLAIKWYIKAAEKGDTEAQKTLAFKYELGLGVPVNYWEAKRWLEALAEKGDMEAQYNLALMYHLGKGIVRDDETAHMYANISSAKGHKDATELLTGLEQSMTSMRIKTAKAMAKKWMSLH